MSTISPFLKQSTPAQPIFALIQEDLQEVEDQLQQTFTSLPFAGAARSLIAAGGKRIRPALVLLTGSLGQINSQVKDLAVAVETLHLATLVHDDILDQAELRRNQPAAHVRLGVNGAILLGDYFYGQFLSLISRCDQSALRGLSKVIRDLVKAEFDQQQDLLKDSYSEEAYLQRIGCKAGSFLGECCRLGALLAGVDSKVSHTLATFGYCLGIAFQLQDDWLDFASSPTALGKPVSQDITSGVVTLPVIHCLQHSSYRDQLLLALRSGFQDPSDLRLLSQEIQPSLTYTAEQAQKYAVLAIAALAPLPDSTTKDALAELACFAVARRN